jgi:virginiamycin B lyase
MSYISITLVTLLSSLSNDQEIHVRLRISGNHMLKFVAKRVCLPLLLAAIGSGLSLNAMAGSPPAISEFSIPTLTNSPAGIAAGPDGALWFVESNFSLIGKIGRITTGMAPVVTEFPLTIGNPRAIAAGPDGAMWFTVVEGHGGTDKIGRITMAGVITEFPTPTPMSFPEGITLGPDGAMWFTESNNVQGAKIGRITTGASPTITEFPIPTATSEPIGITLGPDGAMWFTESAASKIGRITTGATPTIAEYPTPTSHSTPTSITLGPDGALWFTETFSGKIGRITTGLSPIITEYPVLVYNSSPQSITSGTDGALWFTEGNANRVGRIFPGDPIFLSEYLIPSVGVNGTSGIALGADGAIWFTEAYSSSKIGRITGPVSTITVNLWGNGQGSVTSNSLGSGGAPVISCQGGGSGCSGDFPNGTDVTLTASAAAGSTFQGWTGGGGCPGTGNCVVRLGGDINVPVTFTLDPTTAMLAVVRTGNGGGIVSSQPSGIACGGGCNASFDLHLPITLTATATSGSTFTGWSGGGCEGIVPCTVTLSQAAMVSANFVTNSSSDVVLVSALLPTSRSVQVGMPATFFGTMINASTTTAGSNCTVAPTTSVPATFFFQSTDSATNGFTGTPNTPVTIAPGAAQSFILALTPQSAFAPSDVAFSFTCTNSSPAASSTGLNTLLLSGSATPIPDVIVLAATASHDGIVNIPGATGTGAFAVATANVGAGGAITASADSGAGNLPVTTTICQTDPISGQCLSGPAATAQATINANATPTFAIFVKGSATIPFQPAANRIFVKFKDAAGAIRGSTSVAVRTQ